jgi:hypothetical protein
VGPARKEGRKEGKQGTMHWIKTAHKGLWNLVLGKERIAKANRKKTLLVSAIIPVYYNHRYTALALPLTCELIRQGPSHVLDFVGQHFLPCLIYSTDSC